MTIQQNDIIFYSVAGLTFTPMPSSFAPDFLVKTPIYRLPCNYRIYNVRRHNKWPFFPDHKINFYRGFINTENVGKNDIHRLKSILTDEINIFWKARNKILRKFGFVFKI